MAEQAITPAGWCAVRTPLLPFDCFLAWSAGLTAADARADGGDLETAVAADRAVLRQRLVEAFAQPALAEALFLASPEVAERAQRWDDAAEGAQSLRLERTLAAYFARASARCTPFGLFAGCSVGEVGAQTALRLLPRECYRRHSRLDMDYLWRLAERLDADPDARKVATYRPNSTLYASAGRLRYVEAAEADGAREYRLVGASPSPYLTDTLERARAGASTDELAAALADDDITVDEAVSFVHDLVDAQLLVSDWQPTITGTEPVDAMVDRLCARPETAAFGEQLGEANAILHEADEQGVGQPRALYHRVASVLDGMPATPELAQLVQVDMVKPVESAVLGRGVVDEAIRAVRLLQRVSAPDPDDMLTRLRDAFRRRYEEWEVRVEVPLVEVLDEDVGPGWDWSTHTPHADASPLLAGLTFPQPEQDRRSWRRRDEHLLRRLMEIVAQRGTELVLDDADLSALAQDAGADALPAAFSVMATLAARSSHAVHRGEFLLRVEGISGPSGARLLGRFCHADPQLHARVREHLRAEEALAPDAVFAEIVHLPEGRVGNILCRPLLRGYEIPYAGRSGAAADQHIAVDDLTVSLVGNRFVLRSRRLGKEVVPRLTTAHNFSAASLPVYRFLCALQSQDARGGFAWRWGALGTSPFLPRVRSGRVVLSPAQWNLSRQDVQPLLAAGGAARFEAVQALRERVGLPRDVSVGHGDRQLAIDLDNVVSVDVLVHELRGESPAPIFELFPGHDELVAEGPEGRFRAELVIPFTAPPSRPRRAADMAAAPRVRRTFPPGSEWLYAKLYTGPAVADDVLRDLVAPFVADTLGAGDADGWFYLRLGDPWHLRLRLHGEARRLASQVLPRLGAAVEAMSGDGRVQRVEFGTYEREIERYGGDDAILLAERIFEADSEAALRIVAATEIATRWLSSLGAIHHLLVDLGLDLPARAVWARRIAEAFTREFSVDTTLRRQLGERYRREHAALAGLVHGDWPDDLHAVRDALEQRSDRVAPLAAQLRTLDAAGRLTLPLHRVADAFVHMTVNRVMPSAARAHEMVLYEFLARLYRADLARAGGDA